MKAISILLITLYAICTSANTYAGDLVLEIHDIRSLKGNIQLAIYNNQEDFKNDKEDDIFLTQSGQVTAKSMTYTFHDLPKGHYAVSVIHDENGNDQLDMSGRTPLEGLAYSGTKSRLTKPSFDRAASKIESKAETIRINMNYYSQD